MTSKANEMTSDKHDAEAERQYSPSQWSHRFSAEEVISRHIDIITTGSQDVLRQFPKHELGVNYGPREKQKCDIFYPTSGFTDAPMFVFIHGGMWQSMERTHYRLVASGFADAGFQIVLAEYDLAPTITVAEMELEMQQLGDFLLDRASKNGSRGVWCCGHSAGAHLASTLLSYEPVANNPLYRGVILISGIYDLNPLLNTSYNDALRLDRESVKHANSIDRRILKTDVEVLIIIAENDSPAFRQQSQKYYEFLKKQLNKLEFMDIKNTDHFDIVEKLSDSEFELTSKIKQLIKNRSQD